MAENYKFNDYDGDEMDALFDKINDLDVATQSKAGLMSATDKAKLDNIEQNAEENVLEGVRLGGTELVPSEKKVNIPVDNAPTEGSSALVRSGGVAAALAAINQFRYQVVETLPTASADTMRIIYLVPSENPGTENVKDEFITIDNGESADPRYTWEQIGSTTIDISGKADKDLDAVEGNLAKFDANGNPIDSDIPVTKFDDIDSQIADIKASPNICEGLADTISKGVAQEFVFRKSGGDGVNYLKRIKGKSLVWNQLVETVVNSSSEVAGITRTKVSRYILHYSGTSTTSQSYTGTGPVNYIANHKYYVAAIGNLSSSCEVVPLDSRLDNPALKTIITPITDRTVSMGLWIPSGVSVDADVSFNSVDLTLLYGSEITGLTDAQILAKYEAEFGDGYYPNNNGELICNDAEVLETDGFNQWDEEWELGVYNADTGLKEANSAYIRSKNLIPIISQKEYYIKVPSSGVGYIRFFNANKEYMGRRASLYMTGSGVFNIPAGAVYIVFQWQGTIYNHDICINLSDPTKNGTYEPYWKRTLNLGITTKEDTDGNVPFPNGLQSCPVAQDEATKEGGTIRVGTRAYQAGDESDANVITDGTNTNYALAPPVPFTWAEPMPNAILVDSAGTERAVYPVHEDGTPSAPFKCDSNYSISIKNLLAKLSE